MTVRGERQSEARLSRKVGRGGVEQDGEDMQLKKRKTGCRKTELRGRD